ncbi:Clavaminate synthase-like protein [Delitschia confertaspora ATCC 74209]|uniref:Clavaminate synthase-like protein n=1 Tax=Delitschia confertaspora ATCC 74209 TaxID=1513339 RepID=A0A9P4JTJ0_9PLEO|nr:Clavaminate synthase-like protein [Delitschia confertaspora ATCC 74209]
MTSFNAQKSDIPVIDISIPSSETPHQILHAASTYGFLFIKNDNVIPQQDIDRMFDVSRNFFHSPISEKAPYSIHSETSGGKNRGWVGMQAESLNEHEKQGDPKEAFNMAEPTIEPPQPLPPILDASRDLITSFQTQCHALCNTILTHLAAALDIASSSGGAHWFAERHDQLKGTSGTIFRLLYYPPTKGSDSTSIRAGAHSDYGSLTLLFRKPTTSSQTNLSENGLELLTPSGSWSPVPINPSPSTLSNPPILVNIGDLLSFWTRGLLRSTVHRVVFNENENGRSAERYSMAYFCHPVDDAVLEGIPSTLVQEFEGEDEQRRKLGLGEGEGEVVLTARQHLDRRLRVTYGLKE